MNGYKICLDLYRYGRTSVSIGTAADLEKAKDIAKSIADLCEGLTACDLMRVYVEPEEGIGKVCFEIQIQEED